MIEVKCRKGDGKPAKKYPYVGINHATDTIVLFKEENKGTILYHKDLSKIGECTDGCNEVVFSVYAHTVCLKNVL